MRSSLIACLAVLVSCSGGGDADGSSTSPPALEGFGNVTIEVTDDPFTHELVTSALVRIDQVRVHATETASPGWRTVYEGQPLGFNLLDLRNGVTRTLLYLADLPAGRYDRVRLRVEGGVLELVNGNVYTSANGTLQLTSTATSGMQIRIDPPLVLQDGMSETLLLDFDLSKTFRPIPANDPLAASRYQLHKGVRAANLSTSGALRGTITTSGGATLVEGATVSVLPPGEPDPAAAVASTASDANGSWMVIGLEPGTYDVLAARGTLDARAIGVQVVAGSATLVDLDLD